MNTALEKLLFRVGLVDNASKPVAAITKRIESMKRTADTGFSMIRNGAAGAAAAGAGLYAMVNPIRDINKALGEVRSLDVANSELEKLEKTSLRFQKSYGGSAAEFIRSSYDIQSSISGLVNGELAEFTYASNILAKGTKSDAATITDYMGTMYGIFKDNADKMGKAEWVRQLTGQTATAVQMFKTTGSEMASSFSNIGSSATTMGVSIEEQLAILGHLQSTMKGSEAATKYRSFLNGAGQAQKALNMQFTDATGKLLPMNNILGKLHDRFGDTFTLAESDSLKKAFGSDEAISLIKNLIGSSSELEMSINKLGNVKGMEVAEKMAANMTDTFDKLWGSIKTVTVVFGKNLLPILNPIVSWMGKVTNKVQGWLEQNPLLAKTLGVVTFIVLALSFAFSALTAAVGVGYVAFSAWTALTTFLTFMKSSLIVTKLMTAATWLWNAALSANPLLWIPIAIAAAVAGLWYLYKNWDKVFSYLSDSSWGRALILIFKVSLAPLMILIGAIKILWDVLKFVSGFISGVVIAVFKKLWDLNVQFYTSLWSAFKDTSAGRVFMAMLDSIKLIWESVVSGFDSGVNSIGSLFDNLSLWALKAYHSIATIVDNLKIEALTLKLAIDDSASGEIDKVYDRIAKRKFEIRGLEKRQDPSKKIDVPAGGIQQSLTNNSQSTSYNIGSINTSGGIDTASFEDMMALQGG